MRVQLIFFVTHLDKFQKAKNLQGWRLKFLAVLYFVLKVTTDLIFVLGMLVLVKRKLKPGLVELIQMSNDKNTGTTARMRDGATPELVGYLIDNIPTMAHQIYRVIT